MLSSRIGAINADNSVFNVNIIAFLQLPNVLNDTQAHESKPLPRRIPLRVHREPPITRDGKLRNFHEGSTF